MILVMIVEDEPPILRSIKKMIESDPESGYKVIATARNGYEAISALEKIKPNVLITDIRMPLVDGLALISKATELYPDIISIVLSGYEEFDYAKKALQLGVLDYILKPVSQFELFRVLDSAKKIINKKTQENELEVLKSIISGTESTLDISSYPILECPYYIVILICFGSFPMSAIKSYSCLEYLMNKNTLQEKLNSYLGSEKEQAWIFDGKSDSEKILVLGLSNNDLEKIKNVVKDIFSYLKKESDPVTIIVSDFIQEIEHIRHNTHILRAILSRTIVIGKSQIIMQKEGIETKQLPFIDYNTEKKLSFYLSNSKIELFQDEFKVLLKSWEELSYPQIFVGKLILDILTLCQKVQTDPSSGFVDLQLQVNEGIYYSKNYEQLFENIWFIFENFFITQKDKNIQKKDSTEALMKKIEEYIVENFADSINNQVLSERFGLSPCYLSRLFSEYKGMSPIDLILSLRMERSKSLLLQQNESLLVKDVAELVGFNDSTYFSKIFKKTTGLWPSEYKEEHKQ